MCVARLSLEISYLHIADKFFLTCPYSGFVRVLYDEKPPA